MNDILFTIFHLCTDKEDWSIRWATIFKFPANTTINAIDIFKKLWLPCSCCSNFCSKKKAEKAEKELDYDEKIVINNKKIEDLDIKIEEIIKGEKDTENEKYMHVKEQIEKIKKKN